PLFIGMPVHTPDGQWRYPLSRRISGPHGEFQGMAVANLEPETLEKYFATLDVGDRGLVVMLRQDAVLMLRRPHLEAAIGQLPADSLIPRLAAQAGSGAFTFTSRFDHEYRIGFFRVVEGYPLVVAVTVAWDHAMAPWHRLVLQFALTLT